MKIVTVIGARPQFIKASVVSGAFAKHGDACQEVMIHTGQHYDNNMSDVFFSQLGLPSPDYHLGIGGGTHGQNTGRMIEGIEQVLLHENPDIVLVYGDTDSTLAGTLASVKLHIPVAHVEAGLRSFNRMMPEEINRIMTDHASDILFTPTLLATNNLVKEGISRSLIEEVGDVMYDVAIHFSQLARQGSRVLKEHNLDEKGYVLVTVHRQENTDNVDRLGNILRGLGDSQWPVIWPLHPRTKKVIQENNLNIPSVIKMIEPVGYLDMLTLEKHACVILTDSGGVQKEAYFHQVKCITLRDETEWVELVTHGVNSLAGTDPEKISRALMSCDDITFPIGLYGDGTSAEKIAYYILS